MFPKTEGPFVSFELVTNSASIQKILILCVSGLQQRGIVILEANATFNLHCFRRGGASIPFSSLRKHGQLKLGVVGASLKGQIYFSIM
jgi:hypothetical protein